MQTLESDHYRFLGIREGSIIDMYEQGNWSLLKLSGELTP